jgi:catechol 2,3-dioxygenase-like lactoylglutathione lyase family enzyme
LAVVRYLVNDVDASLPFYTALGFKLADRWGPPFAIVKRKEVKDIAATIEALKAQGAVFRSKPIKGPGGQQVIVEDPSGNPIELFQPRAEESDA